MISLPLARCSPAPTPLSAPLVQQAVHALAPSPRPRPPPAHGAPSHAGRRATAAAGEEATPSATTTDGGPVCDRPGPRGAGRPLKQKTCTEGMRRESVRPGPHIKRVTRPARGPSHYDSSALPSPGVRQLSASEPGLPAVVEVSEAVGVAGLVDQHLDLGQCRGWVRAGVRAG